MPTPQEPLRLLRHEDLLVLDFSFTNLRVSADAASLERLDAAAQATITVTFPFQYVAETAFFEFKDDRQAAGPPPVGALAAAPTRLVFALPDGTSSIPFSVDGLLGWSALVPVLAPNALPPGTVEGPKPAEPTDGQTAIEFPYRLILSPDGSGRWIHRTGPFAPGGRAEVWHTRLRGASGPALVRAIWRRPVPDTLNTSLRGRDLDEIMLLSSDFTIKPKTAEESGLSQAEWTNTVQQAGLLKDGQLFHYVPAPLDADELMFTPLGASARLRGRWDYPGLGMKPDLLERLGMPVPSLADYEHVAGLGRDQYVKVVRRGFVHCGMRASIVRVTERRFEASQIGTRQTPNGTVGVFGATAYLRQYFKVVLQEPSLSYANLSNGYASGGLEMPLRALTLTTLETPELDLPGGHSPQSIREMAKDRWLASHHGQPIDEQAVGRIAQVLLENLFKEPFWIRAGGADFEFGFIAVDWEGRMITSSMPLLFVPQEALGKDPRPKFAEEPATGVRNRQTRPMANQRIALADPAGAKPGSTASPTQSLTFELQIIPPDKRRLLPRGYLPNWLLTVSGAQVFLEQVAQLTGREAAVDAEFHPAYLGAGLHAAGNAAGVFATFKDVTAAFGGAAGGGLARPAITLNQVSAVLGATSGLLTDVGNLGSALDAFKGAKLLGLIELKDVLADLVGLDPGAYRKADQTQTEAELKALLSTPGSHLEIPVLRTVPILRDGKPVAVETRLLWKPRLRTDGVKLLSFGDKSELVLDVRHITPLDGAAPTSEIHGELRAFAFTFAEVVKVSMGALRFASLPGRKPDVAAERLALDFLGPLRFINTLRSVIPADGFSDPPAIQVTPEGISAGFSLGVPTVGVGVFSLQNLTLSSSLSIPFIGKPAGLRFALSDRHHPFLVTVTLFGGGGFFALGVSASGVEEIEASIEFGGNVSLNLGVASGGVYVMAGVYFGLTAQATVLTGYLRCGGYLSVLGLICVTVEFYMALTYRDVGAGSEAWGQATLTVCVKVACFSKSVGLSLERRFAGASGDPTLDQVIDHDDWQEYCLGFAAEGAA
jgi:hypothetical protein